LDLAAGEVGVDRALRTLAHAPFHREHELAAELLGLGEHFGAVRIEHDLKQSLAVAKVDEDHAAVIAAPMHPTRDANLAPDVRPTDLTAVMTAHRTTLVSLPPNVPLKCETCKRLKDKAA